MSTPAPDAARPAEDVRANQRAALHSIWRELAEKGIERGVDWPRVVLDLFRALDEAERSLAQARAEALDEACAVVERQTNLADLVHFDKPSDFRKGVLTCLAALQAARAAAQQATTDEGGEL